MSITHDNFSVMFSYSCSETSRRCCNSVKSHVTGNDQRYFPNIPATLTASKSTPPSHMSLECQVVSKSMHAMSIRTREPQISNLEDR